MPVRAVILRLRNARSSAAEIAGSSFGTSRGSASTTVTSTPNERQAEANSTPITPPPSTIADAGSGLQPDGVLAGQDPVAVDLQPGQRLRAYEPVASTRWRRDVQLVADATSTAGRPIGPTSRPSPATTVMLRDLISPVSPL